MSRESLRYAEDCSTTATNQTWQAIGNINWLARSMDWSQKSTKQAMEEEVGKLQLQVNQVKRSADAATSASRTAEKTLNVSERAYLIAGAPALDVAAKIITFPIINLGHIPSGKATLIIHEATINVIDPGAPSMSTIPVEAHWKSYLLDSVPPTAGAITYSANVPLRGEDADRVNKGLQQFFTVGTISYNDGFAGTPETEWHFCEAYVWSMGKKSAQWVPCEWALYMRQITQFDHYPENESK
jgi:hypothetical protein